MKSKLFCKICFLLTILIITGTALADKNFKQGQASVFFPQTTYKFKPVVEGVNIIHDFTVKNKGTKTLKIEEVETDWGCTSVFHTRQISPGGEGKIRIKVNTIGYADHRLNKTIRVLTNDPDNKQTKLTITGNIKKFADISSHRIILRGAHTDKLTGTVTIKPQKKLKFKITKATAKKGEFISWKLSESGQKYLLTVKNIRKSKGTYSDIIKLKTNSNIQPFINIAVIAIID